MAERVDDVTIVGGGTAGWLTATALAIFLNRTGGAPPVKLRLIESPKLPIIGVGEGTVRGIVQLFRQLGLSEAELFRRCNASFKLAARFVDWSRDEAGQPLEFYHPFNHPRPLDGISAAYHYQRFGSRHAESFCAAMAWNEPIAKAGLGPRLLGSKDYESVIDYSYHFDASLLANYLRELCLARGVEHRLDEVVEVERDARGHIAALQLEAGGRQPVALVIDCTGFHARLINGALAEPFLDYSDRLFCDRAQPVQIPHIPGRPLEPATRATALSAGWCFRIPLFSRVGTGTIYSSRFLDDETARQEFLAHLRRCGDLPAGAPEPEPRVIRMRVGRARRAWVGNCVGIGLSSGFIEPLEATAIHLIEGQIRQLVTYFPDRSFDPSLAEIFNAHTAAAFDAVVDFVQLHYATSNRTEPFWQAARAPEVVTDSLKARLKLWRHALPSDQDVAMPSLFNEWSYLYCLWPKGLFADASWPLSPLARRETWERWEAALERETDDLLGKLPDHWALLRDIRGEPEPAAAPAPRAPAPAPSPALSAGDLPEALVRRFGRAPTIPFGR